MQNKQNIQSRNFVFPGSREDIEIVTYKDQDNIFKNSEANLPILKKAFLEMNDTILTFYEPKETDIYILRIISPSKAIVLQFNSLSGTNRPDYSTETISHELSLDELDQIKSIIISSITAFLELFSNYYDSKSNCQNQNSSETNNDLTLLLRFSNGVKIRFLDELMSLYLALNGQTYFDVVAHIIISGAYTFGSLFSITGLYYAANLRLTGKTMLHGAIRRSFLDNSESTDKGEIHTLQGLSILHLRQFKLRQKRTAKPKITMKYESISIIDDDNLNQKADEEIPISSDQKRIYEKVKDYKLLSLDGIQQMSALHEELVTVINDPDFAITIGKIRPGNLSSLISILQLFDDPKFENLITQIDTFLNHRHDKMIYDQVITIDMLSLGKYRDVVKRNIVRFIALLESEPLETDLTDSLVQKFTNSSDPTDLIFQCLQDFLEIIS